MPCINVIAGETDVEAELLATSLKQQFLCLIRNHSAPLQPPIDDLDEQMSEYEKAALLQQLGASIIDSPITVKGKLQAFIDQTQANELMINSQIYDHNVRNRSYEIVKEIKL
jgi:alkanesulfonate monooxygenase SsuD/methylene tetrahydromethanopterin reductase-like flavin-dependent oxidoreductase (luciferase family)